MDETLRMTPMDRTNDLRRPPTQIALQYLAIMRARLEDVPERASFDVVHDQIQMSRSLECAQEMWSPLGLSLPCTEQYVPF